MLCKQFLFVKALLGNKYGVTPLPSEISQTQYETIRSLSSSQGIGFKVN